jgi:hypothetical protein
MPVIEGQVAQKIGVAPINSPGGPTDRLFNSEDYVGIEMELENCQDLEFAASLNDSWEPVTDGSLKYQGLEYRFSKALNGSHIIDALDNFSAALSQHNMNPYTQGNRGSTHFHINISNLSMQELYNFTLMAYFCEPILMDMCTIDRRYNSFSVTGSRTKDQLQILSHIAAGNIIFHDNEYKYRAIGLNSIYNKGSLEFRMFHATSSTEKITKWLNFILEMKHVALTTSDLAEVIRSAITSDITTVIKQLFWRDINLSHRAETDIWDFVRSFAYTPISELPMSQSITPFYKKVMEVEEL